MKEPNRSDRSRKDRNRREKSKPSKRVKSHQSKTHSRVPKRSNEPSHDASQTEYLPDDLKPISCFVDNKEELMEQLFSCFTKFELTSLLPEHLKNCNPEELKKLCLEELKSMSKELILHVIKGLDPATFVEEVPNPPIPEVPEEPTEERIEPMSPPCEASDEPSLQELVENEAEDPVVAEGRQEVLLQLEQFGKKESVPGDVTEDADLEILELEMRARAIRSLLKSRAQQSSGDENSCSPLVSSKTES